MTEPYSNKLNNLIEKSFIKNRIDYIKDLTMIITEGPRFETKAEIKAYSILGGEIVGMTGYPEVALAKELKLEYSSIAICTNYAAGISPNPLSHQEVIEVMNKVSGHLQNAISDLIILYYS
jgi:5'-methylthioadenosine phosphorylase